MTGYHRDAVIRLLDSPAGPAATSARRHVSLTDALEAQGSPDKSAPDRSVLHADKRTLRRRQYGRTKPGTLLKHQIPLKTDRWNVQEPGFTEIDLVPRPRRGDLHACHGSAIVI